jgi:hypothetical protein
MPKGDNIMNLVNPAALVEANQVYTSRLARILGPLIRQGFVSIYEDAVSDSGSKTSEIYSTFQKFVKAIPKWSNVIIEGETKRIEDICPYLEKLIKAVFIVNVKILASVRMGGNHKDICLKMPTTDVFIHKVYIEAARSFYCRPELFDENKRNLHDIEENKRKMLNTIKQSVEHVIEESLPMQHILENYLSKVTEEFESEEEEEEEKGETLQGDELMSDESESEEEDDEEEEEEKPIRQEIKTINLPKRTPVLPFSNSSIPPPQGAAPSLLESRAPPQPRFLPGPQTAPPPAKFGLFANHFSRPNQKSPLIKPTESDKENSDSNDSDSSDN